MSALLLPLLKEFDSLMKANKIDYWADYGTLLGIIRSSSLIQFEFDLDFGMTVENCEKLSFLSPSVSSFVLYDSHTFIPAKYSSFKSDDGFLHSPCGRIYDMRTGLFGDIYGYIGPMTGKDVSLQQEEKKWPTNCLNCINCVKCAEFVELQRLNSTKRYFCNPEGFTLELPGGCKLESSLFPLTTAPLDLPGTFHMHAPVPHDSATLLSEMYGYDWSVERPKGWKSCACLAMPTSTYSLLALVMGTLFILFAYAASGLFTMQVISRERPARKMSGQC